MSMNSGPCRGNSLPFNHIRSRMNTNQNESRGRSLTDLSVINPKHPEPFLSIPAQVLVQDNCRVHCGMVRKENRFNKWQDRYLVLHKGCLYYYKDSTDKNAQGQFSLSGYRLSTAPEKTKYEWTFKLTHIQPEKRKYFFSAHSQKELSEWFEKISEDMAEYCEPVGTRPGYIPESVQDIYPSNSSCSSGSGEDTEEYDYPNVDPPDFEELKERLLRQQSSSFSEDSTYCPPPPEFLQELSSFVAPPSLPTAAPRRTLTTIEQTEHKNVIFSGGKASVDVSTIIKREDTITAPPTPPRPTPRKTISQNRISVSQVLEDRPEVPPRPAPPPKPLPRPPIAGACAMPLADSFQIEEENEDYLKIFPNEDDQPNPAPAHAPSRSSLERMRPDGNSFKAKHSESAPFIVDEVLPESADRSDLTKTEAIPLLVGKVGVYMIHSSRGGDIKKALSVFTGEKVKHFLIFRNTEGYALDPNGPRFKTKRNMLVYYHEKPLPNQQIAKLKEPYM